MDLWANIVGIRITRHEKLPDFWIPHAHSNGALKISYNTFYHNHMRLFRTRLKSSTNTSTKHDIRSTCRQVKHTINHAMIEFNVNIFTLFIFLSSLVVVAIGVLLIFASSSPNFLISFLMYLA